MEPKPRDITENERKLLSTNVLNGKHNCLLCARAQPVLQEPVQIKNSQGIDKTRYKSFVLVCTQGVRHDLITIGEYPFNSLFTKCPIMDKVDARIEEIRQGLLNSGV